MCLRGIDVAFVLQAGCPSAPAAPLDRSDEASPNVSVEHTLLGGFVAVLFFERMKWGQTHQTPGRRFAPWQFVTKALIEARLCAWQRSVGGKSP